VTATPPGMTTVCHRCEGLGEIPAGWQWVDDTHRETLWDDCPACGGEAIACHTCRGSGQGYDLTPHGCPTCGGAGAISPERNHQ